MKERLDTSNSYEGFETDLVVTFIIIENKNLSMNSDTISTWALVDIRIPKFSIISLPKVTAEPVKFQRSFAISQPLIARSPSSSVSEKHVFSQ